MIGTNNTGNRANTPWMIADGVRAIVERLHKSYPELKIVVLNVFPRSEKKDDWLRHRVEEVNLCLPSFLGGKPNITIIDINNVFLTEDGTLPKEIMSDFLHPGTKGYELWGEKLAPIIKERF
jgi:beta-glucosidase